MTAESLTIRASISSQVMRRVLFKGFTIALMGIMGLLFGTIFIPLSLMKIWGLSLFLVCLGLITFGLLPYRRLSRLQAKPDELSINSLNELSYYSRGRKIMTLPLNSIIKMTYIQHPMNYGIALWLKSTKNLALKTHQSSFVDILRQKGEKIGGADLFLPYFNERAYHELVDLQKEEDYPHQEIN
jgi:hypothetical protein